MFSDLLHTFSIVARDADTGEMGVAVQSHWFNVGRLVAWARAGVGAVATQSMVEVAYGPKGLALMAQGKPAPDALAELLAADEGRALRQVAMVDVQGCVAAHTGARCIAEAAHIVGKGFSVQANMMLNDRVPPAMYEAYTTAKGDLAERLVVALEAAQAAGGDVRGQQSAAILIVPARASERPWDDVVVELRVEDHETPIAELRRLLTVHRAYTRMNLGDDLLGKGRVADALVEYRAAAQMVPDIAELPFWHAVTLADMGRLDDALPIFRDVFARDPNLALLVQRLPAAGMLKDDSQMMIQIVAQKPGKPHRRDRGERREKTQAN